MSSVSPAPAELAALEEEFVPLVRGIFKRFRECSTGASAAGLFILNRIASMDRPTAKAIAATAHVTTAAASQLLAQLIEAGLVKRERSAKDRRSFHLALTPSGERVIEENRSVHFDVFSEVFSCLAAGERKELVRMLRKVRASNPELF